MKHYVLAAWAGAAIVLGAYLLADEAAAWWAAHLPPPAKAPTAAPPPARDASAVVAAPEPPATPLPPPPRPPEPEPPATTAPEPLEPGPCDTELRVAGAVYLPPGRGESTVVLSGSAVRDDRPRRVGMQVGGKTITAIYPYAVVLRDELGVECWLAMWSEASRQIASQESRVRARTAAQKAKSARAAAARAKLAARRAARAKKAAARAKR